MIYAQEFIEEIALQRHEKKAPYSQRYMNCRISLYNE